MAKSETGSSNFLRQFRDLNTREFKRITAEQFMDVWNHYDTDGNGFIEGTELDKFLYELVTSVNTTDLGPEVVSQAALQDAKQLILSAFDENKDGRFDISELAQILPMEENFLLLFRRDHPLESSVEFMKAPASAMSFLHSGSHFIICPVWGNAIRYINALLAYLPHMLKAVTAAQTMMLE